MVPRHPSPPVRRPPAPARHPSPPVRRPSSLPRRRLLAAAAVTALAAVPAAAHADEPAVALGTGGAVASVDANATKAGLEVLRKGGNAVDAAVATAAALGVTEPYSAGVGGGGYLVLWDAKRRRAVTFDGRETAPASMRSDAFLDPRTKEARPFDDLVTSGLSVGIPGTPALWSDAVRRYGRKPLSTALAPATRLAADGFRIDETFYDQTAQNRKRFARFSSSRELFLPRDGKPAPVGSTMRNPGLAGTYRLLARDGVRALYRGTLGRDVVRTARKPPVRSGSVLRSTMTTKDLRAYAVRRRGAVRSTFRGFDVLGMPPSSSGGIAVAEGLNIVEALGAPSADRTQALHRYLEASRLAFADRGRWVGDDRFERVPRGGLISPAFGRGRACLVSPDRALPHPQVAGDPANPTCGAVAPKGGAGEREGPSTTHLVAADRWGNVVSYTLTIEQTGGSGIVVPGRGFLLNNELTDFDPEPGDGLTAATDPNLPGPGKRPRSSMSPTIVLKGGRPWIAIGSPGGATIITTVLQTLLNRIDGGMSLPDAVDAPRLSQRNAETTEAEPAFLRSTERPLLESLGHRFVEAPPTFSPDPEIGAVAALERSTGNAWQAIAESTRRGGGSAGVVRPRR